MIDGGLREIFGEDARIFLKADPLAGLVAASLYVKEGTVPARVMDVWRRELVVGRRTVENSEVVFIERARAQGYTWELIAEELGIDDAERHLEDLKAALERSHPGRNPRPYRM
ncbi:hypothetical protein [Saccharothrix violaceirubra]|uniref:Uncharacterized protein n=1 Tax=Saccharothrix violaceirubra TaxID=413306 RepID=A0A7W7T4S8_9PSEU|nr:hypothetical protein [Saccharothrix violaceirubra]MBB4966532.1 hypothetical protein [Saccharothrix violaceirubra]